MRFSSGLYERQSQVAFDERLNDLKSLSVLKDPYSIRICFMMVLLPLPSVLYLAEMKIISLSRCLSCYLNLNATQNQLSQDASCQLLKVYRMLEFLAL